MEVKRISKNTRIYRVLHRWIALPAFIIMFLIGTTGLLLGWKKINGLLPESQKGTSVQPSEWVSLDSLAKTARFHAQNALELESEIDRMDVRPDKGMVKVRFTKHFTEIQLDLKTAKILSVSTRNSDIIEKIHDGSIIDYFFGTSNNKIKLTYTTLGSLMLLLLSFSGFWLWYNPKRIRRQKHKPEAN